MKIAANNKLLTALATTTLASSFLTGQATAQPHLQVVFGVEALKGGFVDFASEVLEVAQAQLDMEFQSVFGGSIAFSFADGDDCGNCRKTAEVVGVDTEAEDGADKEADVGVDFDPPPGERVSALINISGINLEDVVGADIEIDVGEGADDDVNGTVTISNLTITFPDTTYDITYYVNCEVNATCDFATDVAVVIPEIIVDFTLNSDGVMSIDASVSSSIEQSFLADPTPTVDTEDLGMCEALLTTLSTKAGEMIEEVLVEMIEDSVAEAAPGTPTSEQFFLFIVGAVAGVLPNDSGEEFMWPDPVATLNVGIGQLEFPLRLLDIEGESAFIGFNFDFGEDGLIKASLPGSSWKDEAMFIPGIPQVPLPFPGFDSMINIAIGEGALNAFGQAAWYLAWNDYVPNEAPADATLCIGSTSMDTCQFPPAPFSFDSDDGEYTALAVLFNDLTTTYDVFDVFVVIPSPTFALLNDALQGTIDAIITIKGDGENLARGTTQVTIVSMLPQFEVVQPAQFVETQNEGRLTGLAFSLNVGETTVEDLAGGNPRLKFADKVVGAFNPVINAAFDPFEDALNEEVANILEGLVIPFPTFPGYPNRLSTFQVNLANTAVTSSPGVLEISGNVDFEVLSTPFS